MYQGLLNSFHLHYMNLIDNIVKIELLFLLPLSQAVPFLLPQYTFTVLVKGSIIHQSNS